MELLLRRAFPLVPVVTATLCAHLGIAAAKHWLDAQETELPAPVTATRPSTPQPSPPPAAAPEPPPPAAPPPARVKLEPLTLVLVATAVASDERRSMATIHDGPQVGVYGVGDRVPGGGTLAAVGATFIDVERQGAIERVRLPSTATPAAPAPAAAPSAPLDAIERSRIQALVADPTPLLREGTRVRPGPDGVKVFGVRPGSTAAALGLENGDVIVSVDGLRPTSPDAALELVGRLRTARELKVEIARRGQTLTRVLRIL